MQWKNKTHELDIEADKLLNNSEKFKHIYIFGAGLIGTQIMLTMCKYGILDGFIDNNEQKQKEGYKGYKVYSLEEYMNIRKGFIVVAVSEKNKSDIMHQLKQVNLTEGEDFCLHTKFVDRVFPIISLYLYHKSYMNLAQICLTERCSLKCKKCAHGCFAVDNRTAQDLTLEQVYKSADSFFSKVDFIQEFVLIGGEPLLYRDLHRAIQYIGEHYRQQIGIFSITTNGTILPDEETMRMCKRYKVLFQISNYSISIPRLKDSYARIADLLDTQEIDYHLSEAEKEWMDYGFEYVNRNAVQEELIKVFDSCKTPCREVRENRLYFCVMARSVSDNMKFNVGKNDYLDLDALQGEQGRKELLEFNLGYSEKGYLDMCNYCHGADVVKYPIPVAEQIV